MKNELPYSIKLNCQNWFLPDFRKNGIPENFGQIGHLIQEKTDFFRYPEKPDYYSVFLRKTFPDEEEGNNKISAISEENISQ